MRDLTRDSGHRDPHEKVLGIVFENIKDGRIKTDLGSPLEEHVDIFSVSVDAEEAE
jgi:hypothetical protein